MSHSDPYEAVLSELRAQRENIDAAIKAMEKVRGFFHRSDLAAATAVAASARALVSQGQESPSDHSKPQPEGPSDEPFAGRTIYEAAILALRENGQPMPNMELTDAVQRGGLKLNAADVYNTVGSVLTRRFYDHGDIVRVGRGVWGLPEWYPGRDYRAEAIAKRDEKSLVNKISTISANAISAGNIHSELIKSSLVEGTIDSRSILSNPLALEADVSKLTLGDFLNRKLTKI